MENWGTVLVPTNPREVLGFFLVLWEKTIIPFKRVVSKVRKAVLLLQYRRDLGQNLQEAAAILYE